MMTHGSNAALEFGGMPDIILVTIGDGVAGAVAQRIDEVIREAKAHVIRDDAYREWRSGREFLDHLKGAVCRLIVADDQFTRPQGLIGEAIELLAQPALAIVSCQSD